MSAPKPFFSIIIPALNEAKYLPRLLKDLTEQSFSDFEVIIVDGKSEDNTVAAAQKFADKLDLHILSSSRRNVSHQRNLGSSIAKADWLIFFDADNQLPHFFLEGIKYHLIKKPVSSFTTFIKPDVNSSNNKTIAATCNYAIAASALIKKPYAFGAMIGVKKTIFDMVGGFNPVIKFQEDVDFVRKVINSNENFKVYHDPYIIYSFRRIRKEGTLNMIFKNLQAQLRLISNVQDPSIEKLYPMLGGSFYDPKRSDRFSSNHISDIVSKLTKRQKDKLTKLFRSLLELPL